MQPGAKIVSVESAEPDVAEVTVEVSAAEGQFQRGGRQITMRTDVHDLRLFRDGELVGQWPEPKPGVVIKNGTTLTPAELKTWQGATRIELDAKTGKATRTFTVRLPHRKAGEKVTFSAYAFNLDRVKSATATQEYTVPSGLAKVRPLAYVISVGVNAYQNPDWDLRFAASDARRMQQALDGRLGGQYDVVPITLVSDYEARGGEKVNPRHITEDHASKETFHAVLEVLAGHKPASPKALEGIENIEKLKRAEPDDLVLLTVSSHGYTSKDGMFYLIPSDSGQTDGKEVPAGQLSKWISSDELSEWLREVDAGDLVMIVDTCHSAATVESPGFKPGPMGSRGLGQLAYDKGIRILAASQADDVALELEQIKQGLLTYALVHDGLERGQAGKQDPTGVNTLDGWLQYGVDRVPTLFEEIRAHKIQDFGESRTIRIDEHLSAGKSSADKPEAFQKPILFDFRQRRGSRSDAMPIRLGL
jgi:hypothetical protein